jgi:hypothetical protein
MGPNSMCLVSTVCLALSAMAIENSFTNYEENR